MMYEDDITVRLTFRRAGGGWAGPLANVTISIDEGAMRSERSAKYADLNDAMEASDNAIREVYRLLGSK